MKKIIFFLFLLTSCSLNSNSAYWNENKNLKYEELKYEKDCRDWLLWADDQCLIKGIFYHSNI